MSDNKFILRLKGTETPQSVVEIKNDKLFAPLTSVPHSTDVVGGIIDDKDSSAVVAKSAQNWKLDGSALTVASTLSGDGNDYTSEYDVSGSGLWIDAQYTFPNTGDINHPVAEIFNPSTKWVLKLCGQNLLTSSGNTIDLTLVVKIGVSHITSKTFTVAESANAFCQQFVIDFSESEQELIKAQGGAKLTLQLLCADSGASATIYNGMTVLTALQRRVDASAVSSSFANVEEALRDGILPSDYFNNASFINQVDDGDKAYAVFQRSGDNMNLAGWDEPIPDQTGNSGKFLTTDGSDMSWYQITASDVGALPDSTKYGASFVLSMNSSTFVITAQLKDQDGNNLGSAQTIDLPLESVVVNGSYDNATKSLILTLENGNTITIPVADLISGLQEELVSGTNIKTINGNSILGAGDLQVSGFLPYEAGWTTNSTTKAFCDDIAADSSAIVGNAYLGEVTISDMPAGIGNAEIKAYILDGTSAANKVIELELSSGNVAPYRWTYTYWNGGNSVSGWQTWQEPLVSGTNIKTVNSTSLLGSGDITIDGLPTQTGNSGKLLKTDGTSASWTAIKTINSGSLVGSGNIEVLQNEATPISSLGIGYTTVNTTYTDSINIGNGAQVLGNNAIALGAFASAEGQDSIAIYSSTGTSHRARTTHKGNIAIGYNALAINAAYTIAIGYSAYAQASNAIQLGTGQNALKNSFQVWTYPMLDKTTGLIPSARFADQTNATQGQVLSLDANLDAEWTTPTTVNNATLTIQKNGTTVNTFTANASSDVTANITVPTAVSELSNDSGYITGINSSDVTTALGYTPVDPSNLATVATSGSYNDLSNKPTIPAAQVNADWNANSGVEEILNKPTLATVATSGAYSDLSGTPSLATVATSGSYTDLSNKPTIPTVNDATLTIQKNGTNVATFTANSATATIANITVPTDTSDLTNSAGYITGITSSDVTTALGYTPYDSANPNGYTSNVGTVTSVNNTNPDGTGNVSLTIPTVNDATITITQNGSSVGSFTLNQSSGDTIALTDTTYSVMTGASAGDAGVSGLVPAPAAGDQGKFLQGDGTWANPTATTAWGNITGTLSNQTDLQNALNAKQDKVSAGFISSFAGSSAPVGWLICDGSAVNRTTYADLFAVIGTTYGAGDGSTTFNLPVDDRSDIVRYIKGTEADSTNNLTSGVWTSFTPTYDCYITVTGSSGYAMITTTNQSLTNYTFDRCDVTSSSVCYATAFVKKGQQVYLRASGNNTIYAVWKLKDIKYIQCIKY